MYIYILYIQQTIVNPENVTEIIMINFYETFMNKNTVKSYFMFGSEIKWIESITQ